MFITGEVCDYKDVVHTPISIAILTGLQSAFPVKWQFLDLPKLGELPKMADPEFPKPLKIARSCL